MLVSVSTQGFCRNARSVSLKVLDHSSRISGGTLPKVGHSAAQTSCRVGAARPSTDSLVPAGCCCSTDMSSALEKSVASGRGVPAGCSLILLQVEVEELPAGVAAHMFADQCALCKGVLLIFLATPVCLAGDCYHPFCVRNFGKTKGCTWNII